MCDQPSNWLRSMSIMGTAALGLLPAESSHHCSAAPQKPLTNWRLTCGGVVLARGGEPRHSQFSVLQAHLVPMWRQRQPKTAKENGSENGEDRPGDPMVN